MDDIVKLFVIMVVIISLILFLYCRKAVCSDKMKQNYVYTVILGIYIINLYYVITQYKYYNSHTWKVAGVLIIVPIIMYMMLCQQNCFELFLPTFFIIFPCIMIIFNFYVSSFQ
jgi:hypothetical protein